MVLLHGFIKNKRLPPKDSELGMRNEGAGHTQATALVHEQRGLLASLATQLMTSPRFRREAEMQDTRQSRRVSAWNLLSCSHFPIDSTSQLPLFGQVFLVSHRDVPPSKACRVDAAALGCCVIRGCPSP